MAYFLYIVASQFPFEFGVDVNKRIQFSCNFRSEARSPVPQFENNLQTILANAGLSTLNTDTFIGKLANVLPTISPYIVIIGTSGMAPEQTQNDDAMYEYPSAQIIVGAFDRPTAQSLANACYLAIHGTRNVNVTP